MRCMGCESENPSGVSYCGQCGAPLVNRGQKCGFESPPGFDFCGRCGSPLSDSKTVRSERSARAPAPAPTVLPLIRRWISSGSERLGKELAKLSAQPIFGVNQ